MDQVVVSGCRRVLGVNQYPIIVLWVLWTKTCIFVIEKRNRAYIPKSYVLLYTPRSGICPNSLDNGIPHLLSLLLLQQQLAWRNCATGSLTKKKMRSETIAFAFDNSSCSWKVQRSKCRKCNVTPLFCSTFCG